MPFYTNALNTDTATNGDAWTQRAGQYYGHGWYSTKITVNPGIGKKEPVKETDLAWLNRRIREVRVVLN